MLKRPSLAQTQTLLAIEEFPQGCKTLHHSAVEACWRKGWLEVLDNGGRCNGWHPHGFATITDTGREALSRMKEVNP